MKSMGLQRGYSLWAFLSTILILIALGALITQKVIADRNLPRDPSYIPTITSHVPSISKHGFFGKKFNGTQKS